MDNAINELDILHESVIKKKYLEIPTSTIYLYNYSEHKKNSMKGQQNTFPKMLLS